MIISALRTGFDMVTSISDALYREASTVSSLAFLRQLDLTCVLYFLSVRDCLLLFAYADVERCSGKGNILAFL